MRKFIKHLLRYRGGFSVIFYVALIALLWYLIIPHTSLFFRNHIFLPFWQRLNREEVTLIKGEEFRLYVMGINKKIFFSSSDIKVADVDLFGNVTAYRCGTTVIKARVYGRILKCRIRVIDINKKSLNLKAGKNSRLNIKGVWFGVRWKSSDKSVAVVSRFGKVTAVSKGKAVIYGKVKGKTLKCTVTVK